MHLTQRKIQVKHPIFRLVTINALKWIVDRAFLLKLKKGQCAYRQGFKAQKKFYFVLYGEFDFEETKKLGKINPKTKKEATEQVKFGEPVGLGWTIGEEVIFEPEDSNEVLKRYETVVAIRDSCLLQIKLEDFEDMKSSIHRIGAGQSYMKDYKSLVNFLTSNYETKNEWRMSQGLMDGGFAIIDE